jgi:uncharacterized membrane protein YobD (UPF0266 family)
MNYLIELLSIATLIALFFWKETQKIKFNEMGIETTDFLFGNKFYDYSQIKELNYYFNDRSQEILISIRCKTELTAVCSEDEFDTLKEQYLDPKDIKTTNEYPEHYE